MNFGYDVCVIGTGRVGLPLGLSFLDVGLRVTGVDLDPAIRHAVAEGSMPFHEPGYDELVARRDFVVHETMDVAADSAALVVTVGTPLHTHIETDLRQVQRVLSSTAPHLRPGQLLCLRSTVAPGTTAFVRRWISQHTEFEIGRNLGLAFCPERIAEGKAREELRTLPQIVGAEDDLSRKLGAELFSHLVSDIQQTDYVSAELVKLFNNIARYVHFALANQFALLADTFGANIHQVRRMANHNYPRSYIAGPGLTAGTCLRKDFGMINEWSPYPDLLLSAWKMNEYVPAFLVQHLRQRTPLHDKVVALLGYTFKRDTDDVRDSLAAKLYRYVQRELPAEIRVTDHNLPEVIPDEFNGDLRNWPATEALDGADCVFVATNHSGYDQALRQLAEKQPEAWIADLWNVTESDLIFYQARELLSANRLVELV